MKVFGDIEAVNLSTGETCRRLTGDGESHLVGSRGPIDDMKLGPGKDTVYGPAECDPTPEEIVRHARAILGRPPISKESPMAATIRCKMRVSEVTQRMSADGKAESEQVKLQAVTGNTEENKDWSKWTPYANFDIQINNPNAFGKLSKGHEFFVDFTPCESPQAAT